MQQLGWLILVWSLLGSQVIRSSKASWHIKRVPTQYRLNFSIDLCYQYERRTKELKSFSRPPTPTHCRQEKVKTSYLSEGTDMELFTGHKQKLSALLTLKKYSNVMHVLKSYDCTGM